MATGRRSTSIFWSPEKIRDTLTPIRSAMTLRSSPRKRLLLSDIIPISPDQSHSTTPRKSNPNQLKQTFPGGKRLKFDEKPLAQTNTDVPLTDILKGRVLYLTGPFFVDEFYFYSVYSLYRLYA